MNVWIFVHRYTLGTWIPLTDLGYPGSSVPIFIDLRPRPGAGELNTPPVAIQQPVVR